MSRSSSGPGTSTEFAHNISQSSSQPAMVRTQPGERAGGRAVLLAVDEQGWRHRDHIEQLFLVPIRLIVLRDRLAGGNLNQVDPEGPAVKRTPNQPPVASALELVTM